MLTGRSNRRAWSDLLAREEERCRRYGHPAAVLVADLNRFKELNDSAGHAAGDLLLERTGQTLQSAARKTDLVARLGGDEFGILAIECDRTGAKTLLGRACAALLEAGVSASVGMARRKLGSGLQAAWERADLAMYAVKRQHC